MVESYVYFALLFHACPVAGLLSYNKKINLYNLYFTTQRDNHMSIQTILKHTHLRIKSQCKILDMLEINSVMITTIITIITTAIMIMVFKI